MQQAPLPSPTQMVQVAVELGAFLEKSLSCRVVSWYDEVPPQQLAGTIMRFEDSRGNPAISLACSSPLSLVIIDKILGGQGAALKEVRPLTDIEKRIIAKLMKKCAELLVRRLFSPDISELRLAGDFDAAPVGWEDTERYRFALQIGGCTGYLDVALWDGERSNTRALAPDRHRPAAGALERRPDLVYETAVSLRRTLESLETPVRAVLGTAEIEFGDFLELETGDIIQLNEPAGDRVSIRVGETTRFYGTPTILNGKIGVRIVDKLPTEEGRKNGKTHPVSR